MHVSIFELSCFYLIDLFLCLCANSTLRKPDHSPILIYFCLLSGPSLGVAWRSPPRERRRPQGPSRFSLLPTITCYWALPTLSSDTCTDRLENQFSSETPIKKKKKILMRIWRLWHVPGSVIQCSFCNLPAFHHFKRILGNYNPERGVTLTGSMSHVSEICRGFHELQPICSWAFRKLKVF